MNFSIHAVGMIAACGVSLGLLVYRISGFSAARPIGRSAWIETFFALVVAAATAPALLDGLASAPGIVTHRLSSVATALFSLITAILAFVARRASRRELKVAHLLALLATASLLVLQLTEGVALLKSNRLPKPPASQDARGVQAGDSRQ